MMLMTKNFGIAIAVGVIARCIFAYFSFGLNRTRASTEGQQAAQAGTAPSPTPDAAGLKIEDEKIGTGPEVKSGDTLEINYLGTLVDGTKFDSSYDRGEAFKTQIGVGQVIKGWDLGVIGMKVGGKRKLTIPPSLGYGDQAAGTIPPNSTLIFEVELVGIK